ncbi:MAG TPA: BlaI/MecI/CopY family transcriptional regulator [Terriglobales bacterium]|nr:BlaI/MecI/CopY family transcriptional regulator [Terriglobales bacterium]
MTKPILAVSFLTADVKFLAMKPINQLSRRERQIVDVLFRLGRANAAEIRNAMPDAPSDSAVRTILRILEKKGVVSHEEQGRKYWFRVVQSRESARSWALRTLLNTFFEGSGAQAALALLGSTRAEFTIDEIERLSQIVKEAKRKARK